VKKLFLAAMVFILGACSTSEKQVSEIIKKNPQIVFDVIEQNPEQFVDVVNKAARKAQEDRQKKQLAEMKKQEDDQSKNPLKPLLPENRLLSGSKDGSIVIVEYADFQCPACRMAYDNLKPVKEKYKDKIKFYYKNMPLDFHKMAYPSALYFEAIAKQDMAKAKKYYDYLFEHQEQLHNENFLKESAKKLGVDMKRLAADVKSEDVKKVVENDMKEFENFGFTGTPVIVVNGIALYGAQPTEEIERVIGLTTKEKAN